MSKILNTTTLIKSIKRRAQLPTNQNTFKEEDFIEMINEEINVGILPHVLKVHEEYYVKYEDQAVTNTKTGYEIPYRAIGNKLRDVSFLDTTGNFYELSRISVEDISDFQNFYASRNNNVFYVQDTEIILPNNLYTQTGSLRMFFYMRPNTMVTESQVGVVQSIDRNTGIITLNSFPEAFTNLPEIDFISKRSPCRIIDYDIAIVAVNKTAKTIELSPSDIPERLTVGDYVCKAEETFVPQIPVELHPLLAQRVACHCLEALGDTEGLASALRKLKEIEENSMYIIDDRVEGAPQKVASRHGPLREATGKRSRGSPY